MQDQYQQSGGERPPEPPGPPPDAPPPLPNDQNENKVEVHDYNHGAANEQTQVFDYQHQNAPPEPQPPQDTNVIDYNHGKAEMPPVDQYQYNNSWDYNQQNWQDPAHCCCCC